MAACAVLALALFAPPRCGAAVAGPAARVEALERAYAGHLLLARPDLAYTYGVTRAADRLAPLTEATLARDAATLDSLQAAADAIDPATLGPGARARRDTLRARIAREAAPLRAGLWRTSAAAYLGFANEAILAVARTPRTSPCERARRATGRLRALPELLRSAQVNLRDASHEDPGAEAAPWLVAMDSLRTALPARVVECREPERYADFVEADSLALGAIARFVRFLHENAELRTIPARTR